MTDPMLEWIDYICCSGYTSLIEAIELYIQGKSQQPTAPKTLQGIKFLSLSNEPSMSDMELLDDPIEVHYISTPKKKVQFSDKIDVRTHQAYDEADASKLFYTEQECLAMHFASVRAVKQARMITMSKSFDELDQPPELDDVSTTGLENRLTHELVEATEADMKHCRRAVLRESMRQLQSGECDPEKIACVSRYYSIWAAKRAHEIGVYRLEH